MNANQLTIAAYIVVAVLLLGYALKLWLTARTFARNSSDPRSD